MRFKRQVLLLSTIAALFAIVATSPVNAACSLTASCCSATANCDTCVCSAECTPKKSSCNCVCVTTIKAGFSVTPVTAEATGVSEWARLSVNVQGQVTLGELAEFLEGAFNWNVSVDSNVASNVLVDGTYTGTFGQAMGAFASANNAAVSFDGSGVVMHFTGP